RPYPSFFLSPIRRPPRPPLFPYTTLFRSLYGAIVFYRGLSGIQTRFAGFAWWTFAAVCGLSFANYLLRFLKWEYYLAVLDIRGIDRKSTRLNSSHVKISYAVFCLKKKKTK